MQTFWELSDPSGTGRALSERKIPACHQERSMDQLQDKRRSNCTVHQEEWLVGKHGRKSANECVKCGKCEEVCPQHIKIRDELEKIAAELLG